MKNSKENSLRWLRQAEYDLTEAKRCFQIDSFAYAAFYAEQCAQKSVKSFLIYKGKRYITIHSVGELLKDASVFEAKFKFYIEMGKKLDRHYIISRYPDALPEPAIPAESYTKDEAEEAIHSATSIFEICKSIIV